MSAAAGGHKSTKSPAGGQEAGALCALRLVADYSSDTSDTLMYNLFIFFYLYFCYSCKFIFL